MPKLSETSSLDKEMNFRISLHKIIILFSIKYLGVLDLGVLCSVWVCTAVLGFV